MPRFAGEDAGDRRCRGGLPGGGAVPLVAVAISGLGILPRHPAGQASECAVDDRSVLIEPLEPFDYSKFSVFDICFPLSG